MRIVFKGGITRYIEPCRFQHITSIYGGQKKRCKIVENEASFYTVFLEKKYHKIESRLRLENRDGFSLQFEIISRRKCGSDRLHNH